MFEGVSENSRRMGEKTRDIIVLYGCKRPAVSSEIYVAQGRHMVMLSHRLRVV